MSRLQELMGSQRANISGEGAMPELYSTYWHEAVYHRTREILGQKGFRGNRLTLTTPGLLLLSIPRACRSDQLSEQTGTGNHARRSDNDMDSGCPGTFLTVWPCDGTLTGALISTMLGDSAVAIL